MYQYRQPEQGTCGQKGGSVDKDSQLLIANLLISVLCCQVKAAEAAAKYIAAASEIAQRLTVHGPTVRPSALMKIVRIDVNAGSLTETLNLPIVEETVATPETGAGLDLADLHQIGAHATITLCGMDMAYFSMRVRPGRVTAALEHLGHVTLGAAERALRDVLRQCLYFEVTSVNPMDVAEDYFTLARNFTRLNNLALAGLALQHANAVLSKYSQSAEAETHVDLINGITKRIPGVARMINGSSS